MDLEKFFNIRVIAVLTTLNKSDQPMLMKDIFKSLAEYYVWYQSVRYTVELLEKSGDIKKKNKSYFITDVGKQRLDDVKEAFYNLVQ